MKSVFCFFEDLVCVSLEYLFGDLFLTVSRQTVLNHCIGLCGRHYLIVYLIACKSDFSLLGFRLFAHRGPYVREQNVGVLCCLNRNVGHGELAVILLGKFKYFVIRLIILRTGDRNYIGGRAPDRDIVPLGPVKAFITHGHLYNVKLGRLDSLVYAAQEQGAKIAMFGHTHEADYEEMGGVKLINPGTAGSGLKRSWALVEVYENGGITCEIREL